MFILFRFFPHKTRIFVQNQYSNNLKNNTYEKNAVFILNFLPRWFKHIITHTFFDSDTMLLYKQEKMLRQQNSLDNCTSTYFTPTTSDSSIRAFHVWKKNTHNLGLYLFLNILIFLNCQEKKFMIDLMITQKTATPVKLLILI